MPLTANDILFRRELQRKLEAAHSSAVTTKLINASIDVNVGRQVSYKQRLAELEAVTLSTPVDPAYPWVPIDVQPNYDSVMRVWTEVVRSHASDLASFEPLHLSTYRDLLEAIRAYFGESQDLANTIISELNNKIAKRRFEACQAQLKMHKANREALGEAYLTHFEIPTTAYANPFADIWRKLKEMRMKGIVQDALSFTGLVDGEPTLFHDKSLSPQSSQDILNYITTSADFTDAQRPIALKQYNELLHRMREGLDENSDSKATQEALVVARAAFNLYLGGLDNENEKKLHLQNLKDLGDRYLLQFRFIAAGPSNTNLFNEVFLRLRENNPGIFNGDLNPLSHNEILDVISDACRKLALPAADDDTSSFDSHSSESIDDVGEVEAERLKAEYLSLLAKRKTEIADRTLERHKTDIDYLVLGLDRDVKVKRSAETDAYRKKRLNELFVALALYLRKDVGGISVEHHTDILEWLKQQFEDRKPKPKFFGQWFRDFSGNEEKDAGYDEYYVALNYYYQLLKQEHSSRYIWDSLDGNNEAFKLGYEQKRLENEIASKEEDQKLLTWGMFIGKIYALSQGFFTGGATYTIGACLLAMMGLKGWWALIPGVLAFPVFYFSARSNWLTINEEMGPLLKELFFDPNLAHLSYTQRVWFILRRTSFAPSDVWNAMKGSTNLAAGAAIGILTLGGAMGLMEFMSFGSFSFGAFGAAGPVVFALSLVLALSSTFVYFAISNLTQQYKNKGGDWLKEDNERLAKLRYITDTKYNPLKHYDFNIKVALAGLAGTLLGACLSLFPIMESVFPASSLHFGDLLAPLHSSLIGLPVVGVLTGLAFFVFVYGISAFYQKRTINSTEGIIQGDSGLRFDNMRGTNRVNLDVTGENAPDFDTKKDPQFGTGVFAKIGSYAYWAYTAFFNMDKNRNDFQRSRLGNALAQGMPSFAGMARVGVGATASSGAAYLLFNYMQATLGLGAASFPIPAAAVVGVAVMLCAAYGSFSANSMDMRVVQEKVTATEMLKRDKANVDARELELATDLGLEQAFLAGNLDAEAEFYANSRERSGDYYWGSGYSKQEKLAAATSLREDIQAHFDVAVAPAKKLVSFRYDGARQQGDLGRIGAKAKMIFDGEFERQYLTKLQGTASDASHHSQQASRDAMNEVKARWAAK